MPRSKSDPASLDKKSFGNRLEKLLLEKGWRQSELARRADLKRDSISNYIRGRTFPTPLNMKKLCSALGVTEAEFQSSTESVIDNSDQVSFLLAQCPENPNRAKIQINQIVSFDTATKIMALLNDDQAPT